MFRRRTSQVLPMLAVLAQSAWAQGSDIRLEVGGFGQYTRLDPAIRINNVPTIGARAAVGLTRRLSVEGDLQIGPTRANREPDEATNYAPLRALVTWSQPLGFGSTALVLGTGIAHSVYQNRVTPNEYEDAFAFLAGIKRCSRGRWGTRLEALYDYHPSPNEQPITGTSGNIALRAGVSYAIKGPCSPDLARFDWGLGLSPDKSTVGRGRTLALGMTATAATGKPIDMGKIRNIRCASSDPAVASVTNSAKVTGVDYGTVTIKCSGVVNGLERSATTAITVPTPSWTLTVSPKAGSTDIGKALTFSAKAIDAEGVDLGPPSWSIADPAVASLEDGDVTCLSAGTTAVTVAKSAYGTTKSDVATVACMAPVLANVALDETLFNFNDAAVLKAGMDTLRVILSAMRRNPSLRVSIEGHTDWYGSIPYNTKLARVRTDAVASALVKLAGAEGKAIWSRIITASYGETCVITRNGAVEPEPPPPNRGRISKDNRAAQAPNRRVEIWQVVESQLDRSGCRTMEERSRRISFGALP